MFGTRAANPRLNNNADKAEPGDQRADNRLSTTEHLASNRRQPERSATSCSRPSKRPHTAAAARRLPMKGLAA